MTMAPPQPLQKPTSVQQGQTMSPPASEREIAMALGLPLLSAGPAYTAAMLANAMHGDGLSCRLFTPANRWGAEPLAFPVISAVGDGRHRNLLASKMFGRIGPAAIMDRLSSLVLRYVEQAPKPPIAWLFSELPLSLGHQLKQLDTPLVLEKINCSKWTARRVMMAEHERIGLPPFDLITEEKLDKETQFMAMADAIFCPSPMVRDSLLEIGVPETKLLTTSFGWEPRRLAGTIRALEPIDGLTLVYVGQVGIRKGAHILLEAWARARIKGRLVLAGRIDPIMKQRFGHLLDQPGVIFPGFITDIGALYRSADWFIFPSLEEGGPQVTYEAAGCGLPSLVSLMGAGAFTRHGQEGIVLQVTSEEAWADLIASLPNRKAEREHMALCARARADDFTWDKVGARRRTQLLKTFA